MTRWTPLRFGKHIGKTLPQVICSDPSWFIWAIRKNIFRDELAREAALLHRRLQGIINPKRRPERWVVEHRYDFERKFTGFDIVKRTENPYLKYNSQSDFFNIDSIGIRHRGEWKNFVRDFRHCFFGGENMTKERCEVFFSDESHFINP